MNKTNILALLPLLDSEVALKQPRDQWVTARCPFAAWKHNNGVDNNPSFGIEIVPGGESRAHCFTCNSTGLLNSFVHEWIRTVLDEDPDRNFTELLQVVAREMDEDLELEIDDPTPTIQPKQDVDVWPESYLDSFQLLAFYEDALQYVVNRGIPVQTIIDLRLVYDSTRRRVCFPIRDWQGRLTGLHGRDITGTHALKYLAYGYEKKRNPIVWLGEQSADFSEPIILVESVFDYAKVKQVYSNVLSPLSAGMSTEKVQRIKGFPKYYTMFDNDLAGKQATETVLEVIGGNNVEPIDLGNYADPGEAPVKYLKALVDLAVDPW